MVQIVYVPSFINIPSLVVVLQRFKQRKLLLGHPVFKIPLPTVPYKITGHRKNSENPFHTISIPKLTILRHFLRAESFLSVDHSKNSRTWLVLKLTTFPSA